MQITDDQIETIMQNIWTSVLGIELAGTAPPPIDLDQAGGELLTGCVHIAGPWSGAFTVACPTKLARRAAALMFGMEEGEVTDTEMLDALGEIANIAGGNFKALLPPGCLLSLPTVVEGHNYRVLMPSSHVTNAMNYRSEGEPMLVKVLERSE